MKSNSPDYKKCRTGNTNGLEKKRRRQDHVGQKESGEPPCCGKLSKPIEYRIKDRIEEESERAYHDHDFKGHDDKHDDTGKGR